MIYLITGQPGAGKTLYSITWMQEFFKDRNIYYFGINDLKLPWTEMTEAREWFKTPANSVVVIDECQKIFRPRTLGAVVPEYVSALETHRHGGYDLVFITQDPMLVDVNIRRLVGTHFHVVRTFGMHKATVHEWAGVKEQCGKPGYRADSIKHVFAYPESSFALYKSAEVHTHKRRIPARLWIIALTPPLLAAGIYFTYAWMKSYGAKKPVESGILSKVSPSTPPLPAAKQASKTETVSVQEYVAQRIPRLVGLPQTAPIYDQLTSPVVAPFPAACIEFKKSCRCYTQQGTPIPANAALCHEIVASGYFLDFKTTAGDDNGKEAKAQHVKVANSDISAPVDIKLGLSPVPMDDSSRNATPVFARGSAAAPKQPQAPSMIPPSNATPR